MTLDEILLIPADDIEYEQLDSGLLLAAATQNEEPFVATNALAELKRRRAPETRQAAEQIIASANGDRHLRSFAILMLFGVDCQRAAEIGIEMVPRTVDPEVLGAFIEGALGEADDLDNGLGQTLIALLVQQARLIPPGKGSDPGDWQRLLERYGSPRLTID